LTHSPAFRASGEPPARVSIAALDGYALAADFWSAAEEDAPTVVLNSAMAVPRRYYRPFAAFLAEQGFGVVTYDYRGIGDSAPRSLRGFRARARDWGELDLPGVLAWARARRPGGAIAVVGHSIGGQILGLAPNHREISRALLIGAQAGSWRHWPGWQRGLTAALWYGAIPALTTLAGRLPMRWFGLGEDVPAGVAREWASWARSPGYFFDARHGIEVGGFAALAVPILVYSFEDDRLAPGAAIEALLGRYRAAAIERRHRGAADGVRCPVGHFGFFRAGVVPELWTEAAEWLAM
jgi:predicted alpha/beta hydrolase